MSVSKPRPVTRESLRRELDSLRQPGLEPRAGFFGPDSALWTLGRESVAFLGAGRAALLQLAHPWVAHAIDQHSRTRNDPLGRLRATFRFVLTMAFGSTEQAVDAAWTVHAIHRRVTGRLPDDALRGRRGSRHYMANEVDAMVWVHATLAETSVLLHELVLGPLDDGFKAAYYRDSKRFARLFGIPDEALPPDWAAFMRYNERMWGSPVLSVDAVARELGDFLFRVHPALSPLLARYRLFTAMLMPPRLRRAFELPPDTPANRRRYRRMLWGLRKTWPRLPARLQYLPVYFEALRRIQGRSGPDRLTAALNRLTLGCDRLVS